MPLKLQSRFFATSLSVASLTLCMAFAQPAQKSSAQVAGTGSTAAASLYNGFGANYNATGSGTCSNGTDAGADFCGTDIFYNPQDGYTIKPVANLRIEAPIDPALGISGLDQGTTCGILTGAITNWSDVGGPDEAIIVVYRSGVSGTKSIVNNACGDTLTNGIPAGSSGEVANIVANTPGAIGYVEQANLNGLPSALSSPFTGATYAIYNNDNTNASDFINSITSNPDQVRSLGYNPL